MPAFTVRLLALGLVLAAASSLVAQDAFLAVYRDGRCVESTELTNWHHATMKPQFAGHELRERELLWFRNVGLTGTLPERQLPAYVTLVNGDRCPGRVVRCETSGEATVVIEPTVSIGHPESNEGTPCQIVLSYVRSIVWRSTPRPRSYTPATARLEDGTLVAFDRLRWLDDAVQVMKGDAVRTLPFSELSDLHLPPQNQRTGSGRRSLQDRDWMRWETQSGFLVTAAGTTFSVLAAAADERSGRSRARLQQLEQRKKDLTEREKTVRQTHERRLENLKRQDELAKQRHQEAIERMRRDAGQLSERTRLARKRQLEQQLRKLERQRLSKPNLNTGLNRSLAGIKKQEQNLTLQIAQLKEQLASNQPSVNRSTWYHALHPEWSRTPLWIRFDDIRTRWRFSIDAQPLTFDFPRTVEQGHSFSGKWDWHLNRNFCGSVLRTQDREFGWGLGVHGNVISRFALDPTAKDFKTFVGLDETVGPTGGCVQVRVIVAHGDNRETIYESDVIVGARTLIDTDWLSLPGHGVPNRMLLLEVDAHPKPAPDSADPLDIRDHVNWLEPTIRHATAPE